jgi:hypothetical protein
MRSRLPKAHDSSRDAGLAAPGVSWVGIAGALRAALTSTVRFRDGPADGLLVALSGGAAREAGLRDEVCPRRAAGVAPAHGRAYRRSRRELSWRGRRYRIGRRGEIRAASAEEDA